MSALTDAAIRRLQEAADAPDLSGTKYDLIERIGQGGMGTVYRARDRELGRDVALKAIRLPEGSPDVAVRMLREEAAPYDAAHRAQDPFFGILGIGAALDDRFASETIDDELYGPLQAEQ